MKTKIYGMGTFTKNSGNCVNPDGIVRPPKRLLERLSESLSLKHYSIRTEHAYRGWCDVSSFSMAVVFWGQHTQHVFSDKRPKYQDLTTYQVSAPWKNLGRGSALTARLNRRRRPRLNQDSALR